MNEKKLKELLTKANKELQNCKDDDFKDIILNEINLVDILKFKFDAFNPEVKELIKESYREENYMSHNELVNCLAFEISNNLCINLLYKDEQKFDFFIKISIEDDNKLNFKLYRI